MIPGYVRPRRLDIPLCTIEVGQATSLGMTFHIAELLRQRRRVLGPEKKCCGSPWESLSCVREQSALAYILKNGPRVLRPKSTGRNCPMSGHLLSSPLTPCVLVLRCRF
jgi:hypothetical protein